MTFFHALGQNTNSLGGKAGSLARLAKLGLPVPEAYVTTPELQHHFLEFNGLIEDFDALSKQRSYGLLERLKHRVLTGQFPPDANRAFHALGLAEMPLAVRSSFPMEDQAEASGAGAFYTALNVVSWDQVAKEIRHCWGSGLDRLHELDVWPDRFFESLRVILQRFVPSQLSGVAFTSHPVTGDNQVLVIELGEGAGAVVAGCTPTARLTLCKVGPLEDCGVKNGDGRNLPVPIPQLITLRDGLLSIEAQLGPSDVEFGFDVLGNLHYFQARPITALQAASAVPGYVEINDPLARQASWPESMRKYVQKYWRNRHWTDVICDEVGLLRQRTFLVSAGLSDGEWFRLQGAIRDREVFLTHWNGRKMATRMSKPEDAASLRTVSELKEAIRMLQEGDALSCTEYPSFEWSGIASAEGEQYYVEYVAGDLHNYHFHRSPIGNLHVSADQSHPNREPRDGPSMGTLRAICQVAQVFRQRLPHALVEWSSVGEQVYVRDLTFAQAGTMPVMQGEHNGLVIARGHAMGRALVLSEADLSVLHGQLRVFRSVVPKSDEIEYYAGPEVQAVRGVFLSRMKNNQPPVLVAPYPDIALHLFVGHVSGFIFSQAPLLGHLSIILRETQTPAAALSNATAIIREGEEIEIYDGEVTVRR